MTPPPIETLLDTAARLRLKLQVSANLTDWQTVATHDPDPAAPRVFARVVFDQP